MITGSDRPTAKSCNASKALLVNIKLITKHTCKMSSRTSERQRVRKGLIDKAIQDDAQPRFPRGGANYTLPLGGSQRALLVKSDNSFAKEGEYWSAKTGKALPQGRDYSQQPLTDSANQFIDVKGKETRIRTRDAAKNEWTYARTGVLWTTNRQIQTSILNI